MKISEGTKISELIKFNPAAIDVIASINHHFEKLRNPILRKILASRVTIKEAAKIGDCTVDVFFTKLAAIGFEKENELVNTVEEVPSGFSLPPGARVTVLDVRPDIQSGKDPFLKILNALDNLESEYLKLINTFEPAPLITILKEKNYECAIKHYDGVVYTFIRKTATSGPLQKKKLVTTTGFDRKLKDYTDKVKTLDVTTLEMPGPMVTILNELEVLPPGHALHVYHRKVPHLLFPELQERGINILLKEQHEGSVELLIYK